MTRVFLIRHAEAEGNIFRRAHGHFNGQITIRGHAQIMRLEKRFLDERIDAAYSSDLTRASTTAAAVCRPRGLPLHTTKQLREVCMGVWEDVAWGDLERAEPEMSRLFNSDPALWSASGSESYSNVAARMTGYIKQVAKSHDGETIALFSHGFAIRTFFCELMGLKSHETEKVKYCDNTAVALLLYDNDKVTIEFQSDNSHLDEELSTFANQTWWRGGNEWKRENLRYALLDEKRDAELLESFRRETGELSKAGREYTAFLADEPLGLIGLDGTEACEANQESGAYDPDLKSGNTGWIRYAYVKPKFRGNNFGVQLLGQAVSEFRKLRKETLRTEAPSGSPATRFCAKHGFTDIGISGTLTLMEKNIRT